MVNNVVLVGRLTADPRYRATSGGVVVAEFRLAVDRNFKNKQTGEWEADFINVVAWRQTAEWVIKRLGKGQLVSVEGQLRSSSWTADDGTQRYDLKVVAESVHVLLTPQPKAPAPPPEPELDYPELAEEGGNV